MSITTSVELTLVESIDPDEFTALLNLPNCDDGTLPAVMLDDDWQPSWTPPVGECSLTFHGDTAWVRIFFATIPQECDQ